MSYVLTASQTLAGVQNVQREYVIRNGFANTLCVFVHTAQHTKKWCIKDIMSTTRHSLRFPLQKTTVPLTAY